MIFWETFFEEMNKDYIWSYSDFIITHIILLYLLIRIIGFSNPIAKNSVDTLTVEKIMKNELENAVSLSLKLSMICDVLDNLEKKYEGKENEPGVLESD